MKKYSINNKVLLVCISVLLFSGCSDFLDTKPITSEISPPQDAQVLKNAQDAENAIKSCYQIFGNEYWQFDYFFLGDAGSDVAYAGGDGEDFFQIDEYRIISTDYVVARDWNHLNDFVKLCNKVINYVNTVPDLSPQRKDEMMGEASLYRALFRFQGVQTWGEFPIVTEYISSINQDNFETIYPSLYPARKPVIEVYAAIIADCEVALAKAPAATSTPASKYKPNKGAANALLAKVYATMPNPDWAKVIQHSNAVIAGGYTLLPTYDFLFDNKHEGNAESIWEINGEGNGSVISAWCTDVFLGSNWKKFNTPSHAISNALATETKRRTSSIKKFPTTFADPYWTSYTQFPNPWKMRVSDATQNFYIFRLADILLLKAEALAHTGDLTGAMALVNQVRTRVSMPNIAPATSQDDAINKILNERFVELAFEGQRWFDLKREGKSIEVLSKQTYPKYNPVTQVFDIVLMPYATNITANDLLWPIPQAVLDNNPNLSQNPGY
ncbi:RagB/SusD family nutrient uptake outer membrane protein [Flavobacterium franklandianum]|uniref:RagB/SusD family nutrient uptake outer membrane protein n=1 Tax=Flavobacterium franklandianum TaxID=2594430 RepID=UPI00117AD7B3|nr:RagB/SusD family nutrient uptake outer membrane protein [Flavobacterium franklandianum]TRX29607.1 RagB/SusD family nutrient uptake outer membrane protein [Flavobacterium franklandianum]